jgi:hypothetical protein
MNGRRLRRECTAWNISRRARRWIVVKPSQYCLLVRLRGSRRKRSAGERKEDGDTKHET